MSKDDLIRVHVTMSREMYLAYAKLNSATGAPISWHINQASINYFRQKGVALDAPNKKPTSK